MNMGKMFPEKSLKQVAGRAILGWAALLAIRSFVWLAKKSVLRKSREK